MSDKTHVIRLYPIGGPPVEKDEYWTLDQLQEYVGGFIQLVTTVFDGLGMYVNDEGLLLNLPINFAPSILAHDAVWLVDGIRGNAILFVLDQEEN